MREIRCKLTTVDLMHIGTGKMGLGGTRTILVQRFRGRPFIPSSTIRGRMRWILRLVLPLLRNATVPSQLDAFLKRWPSDDALIAHLLGTADHAGTVVVTSALCDGEVKTDIIPGVRLSAQTRSVARGALFFHEMVPPGTTFRFRILVDESAVENNDEWEGMMGLLRIVFRHLKREGLGRHGARVLVEMEDGSTHNEEGDL